MEGYGPSTYGDRWAGIYDEWTDQRVREAEGLGGMVNHLVTQFRRRHGWYRP